MRVHEVVHEPIDIKPTLEPIFFCIRIGLPPIAGHPPTPGSVEGFHMVGMNVLLGNGRGRLGVVGLWCLILGSFEPPPMRL